VNRGTKTGGVGGKQQDCLFPPGVMEGSCTNTLKEIPVNVRVGDDTNRNRQRKKSKRLEFLKNRLESTPEPWVQSRLFARLSSTKPECGGGKLNQVKS